MGREIVFGTRQAVLPQEVEGTPASSETGTDSGPSPKDVSRTQISEKEEDVQMVPIREDERGVVETQGLKRDAKGRFKPHKRPSTLPTNIGKPPYVTGFSEWTEEALHFIFQRRSPFNEGSPLRLHRILCATKGPPPPQRIIAKKFGITLRCFEKWLERIPEMRNVMDYHYQEANYEVERALHKKAVGYKRVDKKEKIVDGMLVEEESVKYFEPDVQAQKMWLANRDSSRWGKDGDQPVSGTTQAPVNVVLNFPEGMVAPKDVAIEVEGEEV